MLNFKLWLETQDVDLVRQEMAETKRARAALQQWLAKPEIAQLQKEAGKFFTKNRAFREFIAQFPNPNVQQDLIQQVDSQMSHVGQESINQLVEKIKAEAAQELDTFLAEPRAKNMLQRGASEEHFMNALKTNGFFQRFNQKIMELSKHGLEEKGPERIMAWIIGQLKNKLSYITKTTPQAAPQAAPQAIPVRGDQGQLVRPLPNSRVPTATPIPPRGIS